MMNLSNEITQFLLDLLSDDGEAEIRRNDLADRLGCVPSQINYVISSRFTPERGYTVESRRGGGGYIRITRIEYSSPRALVMHLVNSTGDSVDEGACRMNINNLVGRKVLTGDQAALILSAVNDNCYRSLPPELRDRLRAQIFKNMLVTAAQKEET